MNRFLWVLLVLTSFSFYSTGIHNHHVPNKKNLVYHAQKTTWVDSVTANLSLDQKIAQFFMLGVYPTQKETNRISVKKIIETHDIGGVIFFKGHPSQIATWTNDFQEASKIPLFASIDGEWGINMRVDSTIQYPRQLTLGAIKDNNLIFQMGEQIGEECKAIGININLAPVIDVNNNINNPVINLSLIHI